MPITINTKPTIKNKPEPKPRTQPKPFKPHQTTTDQPPKKRNPKFKITIPIKPTNNIIDLITQHQEKNALNTPLLALKSKTNLTKLRRFLSGAKTALKPTEILKILYTLDVPTKTINKLTKGNDRGTAIKHIPIKEELKPNIKIVPQPEKRTIN